MAVTRATLLTKISTGVLEVLCPAYPAAPTAIKANLSFCINSNLLDVGVPTAPGQFVPFIKAGKMSQLRPASSVVLLTEKISYPGEYLNPSVLAYMRQFPATIGKNTAGKNIVDASAAHLSFGRQGWRERANRAIMRANATMHLHRAPRAIIDVIQTGTIAIPDDMFSEIQTDSPPDVDGELCRFCRLIFAHSLHFG